LLEALHYMCYLRSFRTYSPDQLVQFGKDNFFIKMHLQAQEENEIQIGFADKKRLVKINQQPISSYKQLMDYYRVVTVTEDDLNLIKGGPEQRRLFLDQAILLNDAESIQLFKKFRHILENRNALLRQGAGRESYLLWSEQLWQISQLIRQQRITILGQLIIQLKEIIAHYFQDSIALTLKYEQKKGSYVDFNQFMAQNESLYQDELRFGRSLFGAHLDDFSITFFQQRSRIYASRGQQKLILMLIKVAQIKALQAMGNSVIFLLDDFMTDFDPGRAELLIQILSSLQVQLIFTSPGGDFLSTTLKNQGASLVLLTP
jgi:DNA replication and repair protein RecF